MNADVSARLICTEHQIEIKELESMIFDLFYGLSSPQLTNVRKFPILPSV
jgi:hypothetical protein